MGRKSDQEHSNLGTWSFTRLRNALLAGSAFLAAGQNNVRPLAPHRALGFEPLEKREMLSAAGLVEVGSQPEGNLSGKIVYTHGGHGYTANNLGSGAWSFQRPLLLGMIEDLGNQDQMSYFVDHLFRSGATVAPLRPVGNQPNEVVLDNDDVGVTFTGSWSNSVSTTYFAGHSGTDTIPYRFASTSATETATAEYRPNIPESGFYPVYSWTRAGSDRAIDQLYRVHHSGGITEVTVNHRRVGDGLVYLGTYHFEEGSDGYVAISNRSSEAGRVVIADMIRFGNGVGDINRGGGVSGLNREDEAGLYWVQWHVDRSQGIPTSEYRVSSADRDATVSLSPRYAEFMNREADGQLSDRVFVSFHSNAGGGNARGVLGLYNGNNNPATATPNQLLLAERLAREVNDDMVDQNGQFEHNWFNRSVVTLDRSDIEFGEINNLRINNEFDATIVETAFHDNQLDAELMRDPKVRDAIARATYQGTVKYFNSIDGTTSTVMAPGAPLELRAESTGAGSVTLTWTPPVASGVNGNAPTGYRVYASTNGFGFDGGTPVAGGATTTHTLTGLDTGIPYYFKVVAVNSGGESAGSEVVAAMPNGAAKEVLIVNGFDRFERTNNFQQNVPGGIVQRTYPRRINSFDYAVQVAEALEANSTSLTIDTAPNEAVISGEVDLTDYQTVVWILGEESSGSSTFDAVEQGRVSEFLAAGGNLFVSGAEIGWDLDNLNNGRNFYNNVLRADYVADDANTYNVQGTAGSIFEGLSFSFDDGSQFYDANFPDVIAPSTGALTALNYQGGAGGGAAIQYAGGDGAGKVVMFGFPFETVTTAADRAAVFGRVLDFFDLEVDPIATIELILDNDDGPPIYTETGSWVTSSNPGFDGGTYRFASAGAAATATWTADLPFPGQGTLFVQHNAGENRVSNAAFQITTADGTESASVNQQINSLTWVPLGTFQFDAGQMTVTLDAAASNGGSFVLADAVRLVLSGRPENLGDYNGDGTVDAADYTVWRDSLGQEVTPGTGADGDLDGVIGPGDRQVWVDNFGTVYNTGSSAGSSTLSPLVTESATMLASVSSGPVDENAQLTQLPPDERRERTTRSVSAQLVARRVAGNAIGQDVALLSLIDDVAPPSQRPQIGTGSTIGQEADESVASDYRDAFDLALEDLVETWF